MAIWHPDSKDFIALSKQYVKNSILEHLDIQFVELSEETLSATMPVDRRTHQPFGILHGGASAVLAETLASVAGNLCVDHKSEHCVGMSINASHMRSVKSGRVKGIARALHLGKKTQVWQVDIFHEKKLLCQSRVSLAVVSKNKGES